MNTVLEKLGEFGIVPVVVIENSKDAAPLAKALCEGGLACAEITFRTTAAAEAIKIMTAEYPDMVVGAGTVLTIEQADQAVESGAQFIVTPGLDPAIVKHCLEKQIPVIPGIVTPSELSQAVSLGLDLVKFFPAEPSGGLPMIKSLAAPFPMVKFMPTGGIHAQNAAAYLGYDKIVACGGSWMVKNSLIQSGDYEQITALTREAVSIVKSVREV